VLCQVLGVAVTHCGASSADMELEDPPSIVPEARPSIKGLQPRATRDLPSFKGDSPSSSKIDNSALVYRWHKRVDDDVERMERVALKSIGVSSRSPAAYPAAYHSIRRYVRVSEMFGLKMCAHRIWQLIHCASCFRKCVFQNPRFWTMREYVVYFRIADRQNIKVDNSDKPLPDRLGSLYIQDVRIPDFPWGDMNPCDYDKAGWKSWRISKQICEHVQKTCDVDVSNLMNTDIALSPAFPITGNKLDLRLDPNAEYFNFSYPHPNFAKAFPKLQDKIDKFPILALLAYGGFMYFQPNTSERQMEKRKHSCCKKFAHRMYKYDVVDVKALNVESFKDGCSVKLDFGFPHYLKPTQAYRIFWDMEPVTIPALQEQGLTHFRWIAPLESLGNESVPYGFPYGGFCYRVKGHHGTSPLEATDERILLRKSWWKEHVKELKEAIDSEHRRDREYKEEVLSSISKLRDHSDKVDLEKNFQRAQLIMNSFVQLRYAFDIPLVESRAWQIYFVYFSFRLSFALLMSLLLTVAVYLGAQMQIFFTVFGAMYRPESVPDFGNQLFFCLLPILMVSFAVVVDQLVDLIFDASSSPGFGQTRAKLLAVLSAWFSDDTKPKMWACKLVDAFGFFGAELLPDVGAIYNFFVIWSGDQGLWHIFYLGHQGYQVAIFSGYVCGHLYFCLGITVLFTLLDVAEAVKEYSLPADEGITWPMDTIQNALEEHNVRPYFTWIRHDIFDKAFYRGEEMNTLGILEHRKSGRAEHAPHIGPFGSISRYYAADEDHTHESNNHWACICYMLVPVLPWLPWLTVCYLIGIGAHNEAPLIVLSDWLVSWGLSDWLVSWGLFDSQMVIKCFFWLAAVSLWLAVCPMAFRLSKEIPNLVGAPFFGALFVTLLLTSELLINGQNFHPNGNDQGAMRPLMTTAGEQEALQGGLPRWWHNPGVAQSYPVCRMRWGARGSQVSSLELGALAWTSYAVDCNNGSSSVSGLLNQSFWPAPELLQCNDYSDIPRWIAVRFRGKPEDNGEDTIVVAVKGTSTKADGYLDTDLFTTIEVLQMFSFMAPILKVVPEELIAWLLGKVKVATVGRGGAYEQSIWNSLVSNLTHLQSNNPRSKLVLTGHSLGGAIAEVVAARLGLSALVWSAPGTRYLERFFNITEEQEQRDVVVVMPDNDVVPRVDVHTAVVQKIQCWKKNHQVESPLECHSIAKSSCEVWRVCGDEPKRRNFNYTCSPFVNATNLGMLYPVLDKPIIAH